MANNVNIANHSLLCWGTNRHGELGLGGVEETQVVSPREVAAYKGVEMQCVSCGEDHSAFVDGSGVLRTCGSNDVGQLGHDKSNSMPEVVSILDTQVTVCVSCGSKHTIALTDTGQTFTWGSNSHGQLGRSSSPDEHAAQPKLVKSLACHFVLSVACGEHHNLALTSESVLYSWGGNSHGELGQGMFSERRHQPQPISSLAGVPLAKVVAGSNHSMALTVSGAIFSWGKNRFGQLGNGDESDRFHPTPVKSLRYQHIAHVDAGDEHSVALTRHGGVFTWGAGSQGQLGHNTMTNEMLPKKVFELMGETVSMVAAGRRHTMAYVPSSGRTYTFGLGGSGQLGTGQLTNSSSPSCIRELVPKGDPHYVIKRLFAGGDHCFCSVTSSAMNLKPDDMRVGPSGQRIHTITPQFLDSLISVPPSFRPSVDVLEEVQKVLSSQACINASFLLPNNEHYGCNSKNHGVDLDAATDGFDILQHLPNKQMAQKVHEVVERSLLTTLPSKPPDMEAMRVFLTLPCCHLFNKPEYYTSVQCPFAKAVLKLDKIPAQVLDKWWMMVPLENFSRIIQLYKHTVLHMLSLASPLHEREMLNRQRCLKDCMELLKKLHVVNEHGGSPVPYNAFYIPELKDKLDIRADYVNWLQIAHRPTGQLLSFCDYPFVFDGGAKTLLLQTDAMIQMQVAIDEVMRRNLTSMILPEIDPVNPCLVLYVMRDNILRDTIGQLSKQGMYNFKKPLKVTFVGEEAQDAGGVKKEFFLLIMRELLDPKYGMFQYFEDSRLLWFNAETFEGLDMFQLVGLVCGLAIYNAIIIDLTFPLALFKKLLGQQPTLEDLCDLSPYTGSGMKQMLAYEGDDFDDTFCLTFEITRDVYGQAQSEPLVPGGKDKVVTKANRGEYVERYIDYIFNKSTQQQFQAFSEGFHRVCGGRVLSLFHPQELQAMVVGSENYDWQELEKNCEYKGGYHRDHHTIRFFWQVFQELALEDKKKFLRFLTGCDRIPIHGMKAIKMHIQPTAGGTDFLPVAHTCFNLLDLPIYTSRQKLQEKLTKAIQQTEGFGLV